MPSSPIKVYCNYHGTYFNTSERKMQQMADADIECACCGRYVNTLRSQAFTLPERQDNPGAPACNCFFYITGGRHSNDKIRHEHRGKSIRDVVEDYETSERDHLDLYGNF